MKASVDLLRTRPALVWLVLMAATVASWSVGAEHALDKTMLAVLVLVVAFVKVHLVARHFMELRDATPRLRWAVDSYAVAVCGILVALVLLL